MRELYANGCKAVIYVEYVPVDRETAALAFDDADRRIFESRVMQLRRCQAQLMFLMFPGMKRVRADAWQPAGDFSISMLAAVQNPVRFPPIQTPACYIPA